MSFRHPTLDTSREYSLICEGPCNDGKAFTADVAVARAYDPLASTQARAKRTDALALLRELRHTPHHMTRATEAKCDTCGTVRIYG